MFSVSVSIFLLLFAVDCPCLPVVHKTNHGHIRPSQVPHPPYICDQYAQISRVSYLSLCHLVLPSKESHCDWPSSGVVVSHGLTNCGSKAGNLAGEMTPIEMGVYVEGILRGPRNRCWRNGPNGDGGVYVWRV
jgi:hypothetical protein